MKAQSAMEYLMTYGWSILILAVVIAALYYLGVFNTGSAQSNVCLGITGYTCQNPVLYASGQLNVTLGQIGQAITVTNTYCTSNSAPPQNAGSGNLNIHVYQDQNAQIQFQCPLTSTAIGTQFSGYIWIVYNTGTQTGIVQEVGAVKASVIAGGSGPNSAYGYVPITITNSQSTATGSNFQDMVTVDSATYGNYINSGWQNVEFTTGSQYSSGGIPIYAWVESNPSNTASSTTVWLLLPSGIAADSSTTVYMNFMTNNVMASGSSYTGEAPQLSSTYAQYDNGASVFSFYDGFSGPTLNSQWKPVTNMQVALDRGLTITSTSGQPALTSYYTFNTAAYIVDDYAGLSPNEVFGAAYGAGGYCNGAEVFTEGGYSLLLPSCNGGYAHLINSMQGGTYYLTSIWAMAGSPSNTLCGTVDYASKVCVTNSYVTLTTAGAVFFSPPSAPTTNSIIVQWVRTRSTPPNGVMPTAAYGTFAS